MAWISGPGRGIRGGAIDSPEVFDCVDRWRASIPVGGEGFLGKSRGAKGEEAEGAKEEIARVSQCVFTWIARST